MTPIACYTLERYLVSRSISITWDRSRFLFPARTYIRALLQNKNFSESTISDRSNIALLMYCVSFSQLGKAAQSEQALAGGKGASLVNLTSAGFPVPPGFVILGSAFDHFLSKNCLSDKIDCHIQALKMSTLESSSIALRELIHSSLFPQDLEKEVLASFVALNERFVAVRSSASIEDGPKFAWAGLFETQLNCNQPELVAAVQRCWASLYAPRTLSYSCEQGISLSEVNMAVVVQAMIDSEVAGTAFSSHPVNKDTDLIVIESAFGLGEAVVSGAVTPDLFVYSKTSRSLVESKVVMKERMLYRAEDGATLWRYLMRKEGKTPSLSAEEAGELADLVLKVEAHYGYPVDVEWARATNEWYLLQTRPITV